ncbi:MAG TPA: flagellar basal-body rod protein FlgF [Spirochaetota bacterium]|nr:flagellar basal-body rod protein FlgF [Spirochaetota bacterium]HOR94352.1 flagellar basal-body rod protein FlgF [Spirochaetota bacterium]HOT19327.1 flagellar basal-body rod protein FlgF [Spirochaetota bacterium]HPD05001.1 flagellar basal-body rod protein FlgF [Spirochaetota bacterium]HQI37863.1 flagellar basal-body rod protein FlgF [Spirochaetota bacterium]
MVRGLYTGASGMIAQEARLDAIANNLANVDKAAYKKDLTLFKAFPDMIIRRLNDDGLGITPAGSYDTMPFVGKLGTGVEVNEVYTIHEQGSLMRTENPFDMAMEGNGFFTVMTERGERYTRNGAFTLNKDGILVTHSGLPVLGQNGIIKLQKNNFMINERGEILVNSALSLNPDDMIGLTQNNWEQPVVIDKLKIVDFENIRELKKEGESLYHETQYSGPALPAEEYKVIQGFLEKSNVNAVREMVDMIEVQRSYEANQKAMLTHDQELGRLINEVAR